MVTQAEQPTSLLIDWSSGLDLSLLGRSVRCFRLQWRVVRSSSGVVPRDGGGELWLSSPTTQSMKVIRCCKAGLQPYTTYAFRVATVDMYGREHWGPPSTPVLTGAARRSPSHEPAPPPPVVSRPQPASGHSPPYLAATAAAEAAPVPARGQAQHRSEPPPRSRQRLAAAPRPAANTEDSDYYYSDDESQPQPCSSRRAWGGKQLGASPRSSGRPPIAPNPARQMDAPRCGGQVEDEYSLNLP